MISLKPIARTITLTGIFSLLSYTTLLAQDGKQIFNANCASCHALDKKMTGPALRDVESRGPWTDRQNLHKWVKSPAAFIPTTPYTKALHGEYGQIMPAFPSLAAKEIDAVFDYIAKAPAPGGPTGTTGAAGVEGEEESSHNAIIFGVISLIFALIALILTQVNSNLKKLSDDKEGIMRPEPVPLYRNKVYISLLGVLFFVIGGYFVGKGAINLGRQKGYQPKQPIMYSHKVHVGINQINCLNICMNCHKAITSYEKGPKIIDADGNEVNGTAEIQKLFDYAGYTPGQPWDPAKAKPIEWVKIHNLPDHVFFSHAQHVNAGKVQCQTCHGAIQEMTEVSQFAELSMGWCVNCHRETKVDFNDKEHNTGNKFYSIYEKFHNDIKSGKMDSVTVKDIGGLECQKCHY
jgi:cytochrome c551/c552